MARIAAARTTHLTPAELAAETLRQFDAGPGEPSIRDLASALGVAPPAVYHHFPSRAAIFQAAVELVWAEAAAETLELVPDPFEADPTEGLVSIGLATRRTWLAHHRIARYLAATPEANAFTRTAMSLMADLFERLGLEDEQAAASFHSYSSFMIGAVLYAADRKTANEEIAPAGSTHPTYAVSTIPEQAVSSVRRKIDEVMDLSEADPTRDEELFVDGLRRLIASFTYSA
jgi:AcrR family transcriptional regulator